MPTADLRLPLRLLAGGSASCPDPRVLRALATPVVGQFDPDFTAVMDDVVRLGRQLFVTRSPYCFAVSALARGGFEAVLNSVLQPGDAVAVAGSPGFVEATADVVRRVGAEAVDVEPGRGEVAFVVAPFVDPFTATRSNVAELAAGAHRNGAALVLEATHGLGGCELLVDAWGVDVCVAGVDHAVGAPSGMSLVTYSQAIEARLQARPQPPRTSYLDLRQLQAYWSPERLNHHTAPTSLVYGLREALRLIQIEGLSERWERHARVGGALRRGLEALGLVASGDVPYAMIEVPQTIDEPQAWRRLLDEFGVHVTRVAVRSWRLGLLGADARMDAVQQVLNGLEKVLHT